MVSDTVLIALIRETVQPHSEPRRVAARWLLDRLRLPEGCDLSESTVEIVRAEEGRAVASEVVSLAEHLGLRGSGVAN